MKAFIFLLVVFLIGNYVIRKGRRKNTARRNAFRSSATANSAPSSPPSQSPLTPAAVAATTIPGTRPVHSDEKYFDRTVTFPEWSTAEFLYVERIDAHGESLAEVEALGEELRGINGGTGFGGVLRDASGQALSPDWLDVQQATSWSSRIALGASISHTALELHSTALDLGGYNGMNMAGWDGVDPRCIALPTKSLFLGDRERNWLEMSVVGGSIGSMDFSNDGKFLVQSEWWGNTTATVVFVDALSQERSLLWVDQEATGPSSVRLSPDGRHVLASTHQRSVIIVLARDAHGSGIQGNVVNLDLQGLLTWWPTKDSTLLVLEQEANESGTTGRIKQYDLSTETLTDVCAIDFSHDRDDWLSGPVEVDPTGTRALCGSFSGMSHALRQTLGGRRRVAVLDLTSGVLEPQVQAHPNGDERFVRVHDDWHWISTDGQPDTMNSPLSLLEKSLPAATVENWSPPSESHVGRNAINTAILALRSMVGDVPEDMNNPYLVPEVRRLLDFVHETCPQYFDNVREYLDKSSFHGVVFSSAEEKWKWLRVGVQDWLELEDFQRIDDFGIPEWHHYE